MTKKRKLAIEDRIQELEKQMCPQGEPPGTEITRDLNSDMRSRWRLSLGRMGMREPKLIFYGYTIEECLDNAENWFNSRG